jgi:hypothetical protein
MFFLIFLSTTAAANLYTSQIERLELIELSSKTEDELRSIEHELESYRNSTKDFLERADASEKNDVIDSLNEIEQLLSNVRTHIQQRIVEPEIEKISNKLEEMQEVDQSSLDKQGFLNLWDRAYSLKNSCYVIETKNMPIDLVNQKEDLCSKLALFADEVKLNKDSTPWFWKLFFILVAIPIMYIAIKNHSSDGSNARNIKNRKSEQTNSTGDDRVYAIAVHKKCATCLYWSGNRSFSKHRTDVIISASDKIKKFSCNNVEVTHGRSKTSCDWSCSKYVRLK